MQKVLILDFGGPYHQLIARRVRECHVYCEVFPAGSMSAADVRAFDPIGIILTGGPASIHDDAAVKLPPDIYGLGIPMMGIGYGCRVMAHQLGGTVAPAGVLATGAYRRTVLRLDNSDVLFSDGGGDTIAWMRRSDDITVLPAGFTATAHTADGSIAAFTCQQRRFCGVQFHPEVSHTDGGMDMLRRFLHTFCAAEGGWTMENYIHLAAQRLREQIGDRQVLLALSGGVDSSVAAALLAKAIGNQLTCIFVDHGLLRKDEGDQVEALFSRMDLNFIRVNAADRFLNRLAGITNAEAKRRIIDAEFYRIFSSEAKKLGIVDFLAQGTIYPDVIEGGDSSAMGHRSMNGLPNFVDFREFVEPLRQLFKDEVRELGRAMGLPESLVNRQPFPGAGLAIRIMGEITPEKIAILQEADHIFSTELEAAHMSALIGQYFAVLTDTSSVGLHDGDRIYGYTLALRAVTTDDYLTAKWARIPYELLDKISRRITSEVPACSRIVYDITSKPPASIEWE